MMVRLLLRLAVFLGAAALGLFVATLVITDLSVDWTAFVLVVAVFAVLQSLLTPLLVRIADRKAPPLVGAAGLISTLLALLVTSLLLDGLRISGGPGTWLLVALVVWLVTMVAALILPMIITRKDKVSEHSAPVKKRARKDG